MENDGGPGHSTERPGPAPTTTGGRTCPSGFIACSRSTCATALATTLVGATAASATASPPSTTTPIQLLAINDFHGNLEPPQGSSGTVVQLNPDGTTTSVPAGGVEYLSTALQQARVGHPNTITVAAGDLIGASPLLSAAFHDEPTIRAMNMIGVKDSSVGNHEFDEGSAELQAHPVRRLPHRRRLLRPRPPVHGRGLPLPGGQRHQRQDPPAAAGAGVGRERQRRARSGSSA